MVMCRSCGLFVPAVPDGDTLEPIKNRCPDCSGTEFKDRETGANIRMD